MGLCGPDYGRSWQIPKANMLFFMGGPQLGEVEAGAVASVWGAPAAMVTGGLGTLIYLGFLARREPELLRLEANHLAQAN